MKLMIDLDPNGELWTSTSALIWNEWPLILYIVQSIPGHTSFIFLFYSQDSCTQAIQLYSQHLHSNEAPFSNLELLHLSFQKCDPGTLKSLGIALFLESWIKQNASIQACSPLNEVSKLQKLIFKKIKVNVCGLEANEYCPYYLI